MPEKFDLLAIQSPVKVQGSRNIPAVFAATALIESLYLKSGYPNPDFSEQFLQWSSKVELGRFANTEGTSIESVLQTAIKYGAVDEAAWPYEKFSWNESINPQCTGENRPRICFTNGNPPASALEAARIKISRSMWIGTNERNIKNHLIRKGIPVAVGGDFFYQAWNHRRSMLPINSENFQNGVVMYPNQVDLTESRKVMAGHAFLIVGWDDTLVKQNRNSNGDLAFDNSGQPLLEKGFFLFKNSWGTGGFGSKPIHGAPPGYGWISYKYVDEFLSGYIAEASGIRIPEMCNNNIDDDLDLEIDCFDRDCASSTMCLHKSIKLESANNLALSIPDNNRNGIIHTITTNESGFVSQAKVSIDISHSYRGDLSIFLLKDGKTINFYNRIGGSGRDLKLVDVLVDFAGTSIAGNWELNVVDAVNQDLGQLNSWSMIIFK